MCFTKEKLIDILTRFCCTGLISICLNSRPFGVATDDIWSYLMKWDPELKLNEVETLLTRFSSMFTQEKSKGEASRDHKWFYRGYE